MGFQTGQTRSPHGVAVSNTGDVYVTDLENHRVQKFSPGVPGGGRSTSTGLGSQELGRFALEVFNGQLYAGTGSWAEAQAALCGAQAMGRLGHVSARSVSAAPTSIVAIFDMTVFKGRLYASTGRAGGSCGAPRMA